jgi:hypothetical protein
MSYQSQNALYRNVGERGRMEFAVRSYALDGSFPSTGPEVALARGVTAGDLRDIDAVIAAVAVNLDGQVPPPTDDVLYSQAVGVVWSDVAAATHPFGAVDPTP